MRKEKKDIGEKVEAPTTIFEQKVDKAKDAEDRVRVVATIEEHHIGVQSYLFPGPVSGCTETEFTTVRILRPIEYKNRKLEILHRMDDCSEEKESGASEEWKQEGRKICFELEKGFDDKDVVRDFWAKGLAGVLSREESYNVKVGAKCVREDKGTYASDI